MSDTENIVRITLTDVYADVQGLRSEVRDLNGNFGNFLAGWEERERYAKQVAEASEATLKLLDSRVQGLEKWKAAVPASLLTALASAIIVVANATGVSVTLP